MKKLVLVVSFCIAMTGLHAQQITRFAVVDTARIYATFLRDSRAVRNYNHKQEKYQKEIQRMSDEIIALRQKKVDAEAVGKMNVVKKYEALISSKTSFLVEYSKACNDELASLRKNLESDDVFYSRLYKTIKELAESQGYTMVLNLQEDASIVWYSPTVDITDDVMRALSSN